MRKAEKIIIRLPCRIEHVFELLTGLYIALQESALAKRRKAMCINALGVDGASEMIKKAKRLDSKGNYILSRSYAYGVTASYLRTFTHLEDLIFANSNIIYMF